MKTKLTRLLSKITNHYCSKCGSKTKPYGYSIDKRVCEVCLKSKQTTETSIDQKKFEEMYCR